jgi:hypothetical protein
LLLPWIRPQLAYLHHRNYRTLFKFFSEAISLRVFPEFMGVGNQRV